MNDLDRHKLAEQHDWQAERYRSAVHRTISVLVNAIQEETKRALEREVVYSDDMRAEYSYADQAAAIQHAIIQAVNNADFRGLLGTAADLHATAVAMHKLADFKESLPVEMQLMLAEREDDGLRGRIEEKLEDRKKLDARDFEGCRAAVPEGGRGVGFHRCTRKGKQTVTIDARPGYRGQLVAADDPNATEVLLCSLHARDAEKHGRIHIWTPSPWEAEQAKLYRAKNAREITRMQERLAGTIEAGPKQKAITSGEVGE
jgi:hypothetical protein